MMQSALYAASPLLLILLGAILLMLVEIIRPKSTADGASSSDLSITAFIASMTGAIGAYALWRADPSQLAGAKALSPYLIVDRFSLLCQMMVCFGSAISALLAGSHLREHEEDRGVFFPLLLFSTFGTMVVCAAGDLLSLFIGLETVAAGTCALIAFKSRCPKSQEAALKYFVLGSFGTALLLYGGALLYGVTGKTALALIGATIRGGSMTLNYGPMLVATMLVLSGLAVKVGAMPFHMRAVDAYEGAPSPTTSFMATAVKVAAFAVFLRVLLTVFGDAASMSWATGWPPIVALMAVVTMTGANLIAGRQQSVRRMLGYSCVAHTGYLLAGLVSTLEQPDAAQAGVLLYLMTYVIAAAGAYGTLVLCSRRGHDVVSYEDLAGLGKRHPAEAFALSLFVISLAGIPPTAGFFAKLNLVSSSIGAGLNVLAVFMVLNTVLAAFYYLRVMDYMYMRAPAPGAKEAEPRPASQARFAIALCAFAVIGIGIWPGDWLSMAIDAALALR